jgi:hypothetical protein
MNTTAIIWNDEDAREPGQTKRVHDVWMEKEVGMERYQSSKDDIPQENDGVYSKELATQMLLQDASAVATTFCLST